MDISNLIDRMVALTTSPVSQRVGVLLAGLLVLISCVWAAYAEMRALRAIDPRSLEAKKSKVWKTCKTLTDKLMQFRDLKANTLLTVLNTGGMLIVVGWIVPSLILALVVAHYDWLSMGDVAFRLAGEPSADVPSPTLNQVFLYVVSQFGHGAILDVMEVFEIKFSPITHDPRHPVASLILAYRTFVGTFTGVLALAIAKIIRIRFVPTSYEQDLEERAKGACTIPP